MRVVHIIIGLGVGGAELMLQRLVEELNEKDYMQHSIISLTDLGPIGEQLQSAGISVTALGMKNALSLPIIFSKLRCELKKQKPDIVQTWMYHADFLGGLVAKSLGVKKVIWSVRCTDFGSQGKINKTLAKTCANLSKKIPDKIVYVSNSARLTHEEAGYSSENSTIIHNGFDLKKYKYNAEDRLSMRALLGYKDSDLVICSVGRFTAAKDHINFIKAVNKALEFNSNIKALMVGLNIDKKNSLIVEEIGSNLSNFKLLGQRDDLSSILSATDIFCLHSRTEGFPNVLGEAMSSSLPCVTTRAGDAELILNQPEFTVDIEDSESLSKTLLHVTKLTNQERINLGQLNRKRVIDNYSLSMIAKKYHNLYLD